MINYENESDKDKQKKMIFKNRENKLFKKIKEKIARKKSERGNAPGLGVVEGEGKSHTQFM